MFCLPEFYIFPVICYWLRLKQLVSGMPSSPPHGTITGSGPLPSGSAAGLLPFTANFINKNEEMTLRTIIIISASSIILFLGLVGAFFIIFKLRKLRRPSGAVHPPFTSSLNKSSGTVSVFFCVCVCFCFVKYFSDACIEILRFF